MLLEIINIDVLVIIFGSLLGSMKANLNDKEYRTVFSRVLNVLLSIFCGIVVGFHYLNGLTIWFTGLVAMTISMLSVSILDTLYILAPVIAKKLIKRYLKNV